MDIISKPDISNAEIQKKLADAWLNIQVDENKLYNPLDWPKEFDETPEKYLAWVLTRPEYFSFICQEILNVKIIPAQALMLKEMWKRRFPMLIASRGYGKSFIMAVYALLRIFLMQGRKVMLAGAVFRQSKVVFEYMEAIATNAPVLLDAIGGLKRSIRHDTDMYRFRIGDSSCTAIPIGDGCGLGDTLITYDNKFGRLDNYGNNTITLTDKKIWNGQNFVESDESYYNGVRPVCRIITSQGLTFAGTYNHKLLIHENGKNIWKEISKIKSGDRILIDKSYRWHNGDFQCTIDESYTLGAMIGDGSWTVNTHLRFATLDEEIINIIRSTGLKFNKSSDNVHYNMYKKKEVKKWLDKWGLKEKCYTIDKILPETIMSAPREKMTACLQGLYDTDGHVFVSDVKGGLAASVGFTNTSKALVEQMQYILLHYGIVSNLRWRDRNEKWNRCYELGIYGINVKLFCERIGFRLKRKQDKLQNAVNQKKRWVSNINGIPVDKEDMVVAFNQGDKVPQKFSPSKIRKRKTIQYSYLREFLNHVDCPMLEDLCKKEIYYDTVQEIQYEDSQETYDMHVPITHKYIANGFMSHNSKIRGQRANDLLVDEFASVPQAIFENVLAGFAAVKSHPIDHVIQHASDLLAKKWGLYEEPESDDGSNMKDNQIIISGTAYYDFNHFGTYWKDWHEIICSQGDPKVLSEYFKRKAQDQNRDDVEIPDGFDYRDYSIIRIPFEKIPKGFMDDAQVARSRATIHAGIYMMEYGAVFSTDSNGFFSRKLIESCVASPQNPISHASCGEIFYEAALSGHPQKRYVYGIDPASEIDNFSIVVIELNGDHNRIVYGWTTNRGQHLEMVKAKLISELDYYSYCAKKIRWLMNRFPCERVMMDSQGGGIPVMEALHDPDKFDAEIGEVPLWPVTDPLKPLMSDSKAGLHMVELVNFASAAWTEEANHGLRKDLEDKILLFPYFDAITVANASISDDLSKVSYDTLEDCVMDIEELKDELSTIIITQTTSGRDKWDTPEIKMPGGKKGRLRKDRYSALVMANMGARQAMRTPAPWDYDSHGGFAGPTKHDAGSMYAGNEEFDLWARGFYGE